MSLINATGPHKVCILLATYNGINWLEEQIDSLLNQKDVNVTIYISDDFSTDGTNEFLHTKYTNNQSIDILPTKLRHGNAANNFFRLLSEINLDHYGYVAFSDQDDIWAKDKILRSIAHSQSQGVDAYSSNIIARWEDGHEKLIDKAQAQKRFDYMFESAGPGCTFVLSQQLALELQRTVRDNRDSLKEVTLHDWFIYAFARSKGYKWYIDPVPTLLYRQHANNVIGANTGIKALKARLSKLNQGWYLEQILLIAKELDYQHAAPIKKIMRLSIWDRCYLAIFSYQYRRRLRDRFAFIFFILFLARKS